MSNQKFAVIVDAAIAEAVWQELYRKAGLEPVNHAPCWAADDSKRVLYFEGVGNNPEWSTIGYYNSLSTYRKDYPLHEVSTIYNFTKVIPKTVVVDGYTYDLRVS